MAKEDEHKRKIIKVVDIIPVDTHRKPRRLAEREEEAADEAIADLEDIVMPKKHEGHHETKISEPQKPRISFRRKMRRILTAVAIIVVIVGLGYAAALALPKVDVSITTKKANWSNQGNIIVNKNINQVDVGSVQIPGEVVSQDKNLVMQFTPTGTKYLNNKASGNITIFNAFSSAPQTLVATTRFQTSDGKIYRLVDKVTVPGAQVASGVITPSSITAQAVADKAGVDYNSGPIDKLTIPGFSGTPRFKGFYGQAANGFSGGFVGQGAYPTPADITKAKDQIQAKLQDTLDGILVTLVPQGFIYEENSVLATTTKIVVNTNIDANSQFSVTATGKVSVVAFSEGDVLALMKAMAQKSGTIPQGYAELSRNLSYGNAQTDWKLGKMTLPVNYSAVFATPIDTDQLKQTIAGKSETDLKSYILSLQGIDKLSASFWPFWVGSVPTNQSRITITVE